MESSCSKALFIPSFVGASCFWFFALVFLCSSFGVICFADGKDPWQDSRFRNESGGSGYDVFNFFGHNFSAEVPKTRVVNIDDNARDVSDNRKIDAKAEVLDEESNSSEGLDPYGLLNDPSNAFVSSNPLSQLINPDKDPRVRVNPDAPGPFIGMALAHQQGKRELATRYAGQYVRYLVNLMYEVSELTRYVTDALVKEKMVNEDQVMGVGQYLDFEFARSRQESGAVVRPTHEHALQRVKPDPKHEVYVYFLFSLPCQYCRDMAPDMERLWRVAKGDSRIKMAGLVLGDAPDNWIKSYREYTGLTMPIVPGAEIAKIFQIRFLPALVVISPNTNTSYLKTGRVEFSRMYELIRTAQGLSKEMTPDVYELASRTEIGEMEKIGKAKRVSLSSKVGSVSGKNNNKRNAHVSISSVVTKSDDRGELKKL